MSKLSSNCATIFLVFIIAVFVTLIFQTVLPAQFQDVGSTDFVTRDLPIAQAIFNGQAFIHRDQVFAVGFPLIVAGVIHLSQVLSVPFETAMRALAVFEMGLTTVLIFFLIRFVGSARRAWLAALLWLTYPFVLWLTTQNASELSFMVFFLSGLACFYFATVFRPMALWSWLMAGILIGISILIRPFAVGVPIVMLVGLWILGKNDDKIKPAKSSILFLLGSLMVLAPWEITVFQNTGRWVMINDQGPASVRDGLTFAVELKGYRSGLIVPDNVMGFMRDAYANGAQLDTLEHISSFVWTYVRKDPQAILELFVIKAARAWYGTDSQRIDYFADSVRIFDFGNGRRPWCVAAGRNGTFLHVRHTFTDWLLLGNNHIRTTDHALYDSCNGADYGSHTESWFRPAKEH